MFLSAVWLANSFAIHEIAGYIRSQIQPCVGEGRAIWERHQAFIDTSRVRLLHFWGTRGIFIGTELLALVTGLTLATFNTAQILFLIIGIICSVSTTLLLSLPQVNRPHT